MHALLKCKHEFRAPKQSKMNRNLCVIFPILNINGRLLSYHDLPRRKSSSVILVKPLVFQVHSIFTQFLPTQIFLRVSFLTETFHTEVFFTQVLFIQVLSTCPGFIEVLPRSVGMVDVDWCREATLLVHLQQRSHASGCATVCPENTIHGL